MYYKMARGKNCSKEYESGIQCEQRLKKKYNSTLLRLRKKIKQII